jgi:hypothetical protein
MPIDIEQLKKEFATAYTYNSDGMRLKSIYLGSIPWPSGKMYMSFACGNVSEEEIKRDQEWFAELDAMLESIGAWTESGECDPCDLYAVMEAET